MNESTQNSATVTLADANNDDPQQYCVGMGDSSPLPTGVYRMVALDLDGTLLQSTNHQIVDEQAQYLRDLYTTTGMKICIATGRAAPSVYEHIQRLALPDPIPVVCSNGARGVFMTTSTTTSPSLSSSQPKQRIDDEEIFYTPVSYDVTRKTIDLAIQLGYCIQYYVDDYIYANPTTDVHTRLLQLYTDITQNPIVPVTDNFNNLLLHHSSTDGEDDDDDDDEGNPPNNSSTACKLPSKLLVRFEKGEFEKAHTAFRDLLVRPNNGDGDSLATVIPGFMPTTDWFLEILNPNVNKGMGLIRMCERLDIPINEVVAIGDGTNDTEFLKFAGLGIAMKNAHPMLHHVADYTTEWTNDEQGVRKTLERLQSRNQLRAP